MIVGIGTDIVEVSRIKQAADKNTKFIEKILSQEELELLYKAGYKYEALAGRFAAKEAVSKALGTGFRGFGFRDIIILNDSMGKPNVTLKEKAKVIAEGFGNYKINISISHEKNNAIAFVVIEI